jgi:hypothetical protein
MPVARAASRLALVAAALLATPVVVSAQLQRSGGARPPQSSGPDDAAIRSAIGRSHPDVLKGKAGDRVVWLFLNESGTVVASGLSEPSAAAGTSDMIPIAIGPTRKGGVFALPPGMAEMKSRSGGDRPAELPVPASVEPAGVLTDSTNPVGAALRRYRNGEMGPAPVTVVLITIR